MVDFSLDQTQVRQAGEAVVKSYEGYMVKNRVFWGSKKGVPFWGCTPKIGQKSTKNNCESARSVIVQVSIRN